MASKVRVLPSPPAFAREAREGCHAEAQRAQAGFGRELRLGKPSFAIHTHAFSRSSLAKREKAATPKPNGRRRALAASYGWASHPSPSTPTHSLGLRSSPSNEATDCVPAAATACVDLYQPSTPRAEQPPRLGNPREGIAHAPIC